MSTTGSEQSTLYTTEEFSTPTVVDPIEPYPRIWVDRPTLNSPVLKVYGGQTSQNWVQVGAQTLVKKFDTSNTPGANHTEADFLAFSLPPRSILHWAAYYVGVKFVPTQAPLNDVKVKLRLDPDTTQANPYPGGTTIGSSFDVNPESLVDAATPVPSFTQPIFGKYSAGSKVYAQFGPDNSTFTSGIVYIWLNYSQLQG
jgi:hypothetical protein